MIGSTFLSVWRKCSCQAYWRCCFYTVHFEYPVCWSFVIFQLHDIHNWLTLMNVSKTSKFLSKDNYEHVGQTWINLLSPVLFDTFSQLARANNQQKFYNRTNKFCVISSIGLPLTSVIFSTSNKPQQRFDCHKISPRGNLDQPSPVQSSPVQPSPAQPSHSSPRPTSLISERRQMQPGS